MLEAADAGIPLIVCITEGVPVQDMMRRPQFRLRVRLVGPNCPVCLRPANQKLALSLAILPCLAMWAWSRVLWHLDL